ncbi:transferrin-binding protein-like solute binding protein [Parvularcula dongshanensis]|uniref:Transferrin-binding protein B C-lobe/N-lobe beta-barrel domain-containing protein n=1 Tax=Parvularcula dongshanensis TaxID=1173995 RepID=A0A840I1S3_9PROT|nr:transferrin-binding protein-like solute binding protein [Parvularcula dongshanensis]MBB4658138.1 hypothetical protein [Parvularcula dongshanensis]
MNRTSLRSSFLLGAGLLGLAACASTTDGGGSTGSPTPVIDPTSGTPAAPKNLVLERTSFRYGGGGPERSETYDVSTRTLDIAYAESGAYVYRDTVLARAETGQSMSYDAATNEFTFSIDHAGSSFDAIAAEGGTAVVFDETFGPLLLLTPKALADLSNGLSAVYVATQPAAYTQVDQTFIGGDVARADQYLSAVAAIGSEETGLSRLSSWSNQLSDLGMAETATTERRLGALPILVALDPDAYGAPSSVENAPDLAAAYLISISTSDFTAAQDAAPAATRLVIADVLDAMPESLGINPASLSASGSGMMLVESLEALGNRQSSALMASVDEATALIEESPGFYYEADGVTYVQYRIDGAVAPTRFVAAGAWYKGTEDGMQAGHLVFGELTDADEMPLTGTATYQGTIYGSVARQNDIQDLRGGLNMRTDFATGALDMDLDANIAYRDGEGVTRYVDYATFAGAGSIDGATFGGHMTGTLDRGVADGTNVLEGSFDGHFYGPTAQEIGGTFEFTGAEAAAAGAFVGRDTASGPEG